METEITWDDPRIFDLPNGQLTIDSVPYEGWIVGSEGGSVTTRDMFRNGVKHGQSLEFQGGEIRKESWNFKGTPEGPSLTFQNGKVVEAKYYARGVHLLTHTLVGDEWVETFKISPSAENADWARRPSEEFL